jgi:hypothetical protein
MPEHHTAAFIARPERWEYACVTLGRDTEGTHAAAEESATRGEEERTADQERGAAIERARIAHMAANLERIERERAIIRELRIKEEENLRSLEEAQRTEAKAAKGEQELQAWLAREAAERLEWMARATGVEATSETAVTAATLAAAAVSPERQLNLGEEAPIRETMGERFETRGDNSYCTGRWTTKTRENPRGGQE